MKKLIAVLIAVFAVLPAQAQHMPGQHTSGFRWYIAPVAQAAQINGETAGFSGIQAGWIVNDHLTLGFQNVDLNSDIEANRPGPEGSPFVYHWVSGLRAEYATVVAPRLQVAGSVMVGGAEAHWRESEEEMRFGNYEKDKDHTTSFVLEPGVHGAYALTSWLQFTAGLGYRFVGGGKSHAISQEDMRTIVGTFGFRLGRF